MCILPNLSAQDLAEASQKRKSRIRKVEPQKIHITVLTSPSLETPASH